MEEQSNEKKMNTHIGMGNHQVAVSAIWWFSSGLAAGMLIGLLIARLLLDSYRV